MSGWFGSNSGFEQLVLRATSDSLPPDSEDLALSLEICDEIRSKNVSPKEAMRSLKRRVGHTNPNVQISAIKLTDISVKNGGDHFLTEVASREFIDNLISILKTTSNYEVRSHILKVIQTWALASSSKSQFRYTESVYHELKAEGFQFQQAEHISSSYVDSTAPPEWGDSDVCMRCRTSFSFTNRKHHCRNCGNTFCQSCSSKTLSLPHLGIAQPVRVCDGCYAKLHDRKSSRSVSSPSPSPGSPLPQYSKPAPVQNSKLSREDEDLKRALELSLQESKGSAPPPVTQPVQDSGSRANEEDADLKAAIEASLAYAQTQPPVEEQRGASYPTDTPAATKTSDNNTLTATEAENINMFHTLVERLRSAPPGSILRDPQIQELYESIGTLRPKLMRNLGDSMSKYDALIDMHSKIGTATRHYDRLLEERLSTAYSRNTIDPRERGPASDLHGRPQHSSPTPYDPYQNVRPRQLDEGRTYSPYQSKGREGRSPQMPLSPQGSFADASAPPSNYYSVRSTRANEPPQNPAPVSVGSPSYDRDYAPPSDYYSRPSMTGADSQAPQQSQGGYYYDQGPPPDQASNGYAPPQPKQEESLIDL